MLSRFRDRASNSEWVQVLAVLGVVVAALHWLPI